MAHSYDQTLIQRMGFSDPDRKLPAHDDACIEIASDPERFVRAAAARLGVRDAKCSLEVPLQKGDGKYASTIGFIDAAIAWEAAYDDKWWYVDVDCKCTSYTCKCERLTEGPNPLGWRESTMLVEVKISIDSIGNLLRQMNLYREYRKADDYVIWSLDPADSKYTKLLSQQGYTLIAGPPP